MEAATKPAKDSPLDKIRIFFDAMTRKFSEVFSNDNLRDETKYYVPFLLCGTHFVILVARYLWCLYWIEGIIISLNPLYILLAVMFPFAVWCCSTLVEKYNFYRTKGVILTFCCVNAFATCVQPLWWIVYDKVVRRILEIRITAAMTPVMVVNLARIAFIVTIVLAGLVVWSPVSTLWKSNELRQKVYYFKLDQVIDLRPNRKVAYDLRIMKDMEGTGRVMPLYEDDLYTHIALIGPSGTGKTSSSILPLFICFLDRKTENREKRCKILYKMLQDNKAYIQGPLAEPTEYDIIPYEAYKKEWQQAYKDYPDCGVTFVSPNESLGDDVVKLCGKCGVKVNILDPTKKYGEPHVHMVSMQPFYVPLELDHETLAVSIVNQAKIFSETLITVNEASGEGGGEQYFRDLNTSVTSNIAIICMLYRNLRKEQTDIGEVRKCINDFHQLLPMMKFINDTMKLGVKIVDPVAYKEQQKNGRNRGGGGFLLGQEESLGLADVVKAVEKGVEGSKEIEEVNSNDEEGFVEKKYLSSSDHSDETIEAFTYALQYANKELFMYEDKMYDQVRGLRNLINDILAHPQVYRVLRGRGHCIDIDRALSRCEITVVNTAIKISQQASTSLGLFFLLNHKRSVLRRPMGDRQMHALVVDEATQYVHPWMEDAISLYRQYHCFCTFSFQSLAQMDKTNRTKYIEGILLTVGNLIVYGRVGVKEMEIFEKMGGSKKTTQVQEQSNKTSIFADTPSATTGGRFMETDESAATATSLRIRGFQEVTWIGILRGNVQYAKVAKLSFANVDKKVFDHAEPFDFKPFVTEVIPVDESVQKNAAESKPQERDEKKEKDPIKEPETFKATEGHDRMREDVLYPDPKDQGSEDTGMEVSVGEVPAKDPGMPEVEEPVSEDKVEQGMYTSVGSTDGKEAVETRPDTQDKGSEDDEEGDDDLDDYFI